MPDDNDQNGCGIIIMTVAIAVLIAAIMFDGTMKRSQKNTKDIEQLRQDVDRHKDYHDDH